ncbi:MAG: PPOX class F420-dependent oxidoreductase [Candidatus Micrarchaeota archaeon]|nr:PPOX class F420-dependent oxidoreductase [Candidatus Micrarchaeota archaeon]
MAKLTESAKKMIDDKTFAHFATLMPDGSPQVSPVWIARDGDTILIDTAEGRIKDRNPRRDPRVAISMTDPKNPYHSILIRGVVKVVTLDGAEEEIDKLAKKYMGKEKYPWRAPGEKRVLLKIEATHIYEMG